MINYLLADPLGALLDILYRLPAVFLAFTMHEFMHAFVAYRLGDDTPRKQGRVTLNPSAHIDWVGVIMLVLLGFGWARPVQVNPSNFKHRKRDDILVSLAGPLTNLVLSFVFFVIVFIVGNVVGVRFPDNDLLNIAFPFLEAFSYVNISLAIFNLLPIPPLDGYRVLKTLVARNMNIWWGLERYGFMILILLSFTGIFSNIMGAAQTALYNGFYFIVSGVMSLFGGMM